MLNIITQMGFVIKETPGSVVRGSKRISLVKQTQKHLITINFNYRRRIMLSKQECEEQFEEENPEALAAM